MDIGNISSVSDCITAVDGTKAHLFQSKVLWIVLESWITSRSRSSTSINCRATAPPNDGRWDYMSPRSPWRTAGCLRGHTYAPAVIRHARTHSALHCPTQTHTLGETAAPTQTLPHTEKYAHFTHVHSSKKDVIANKSCRPPYQPSSANCVWLSWWWLHVQTDSQAKSNVEATIRTAERTLKENARKIEWILISFKSVWREMPFSATIKVPSCYSLIKY